MKAFCGRLGRIIDFEGSPNRGIQQSSIIEITDFKIVQSYEYVDGDGNFNDWIISITEKNPSDYWVSHNSSVEKNFLQSQMPYQRKFLKTNKPPIWGPWLDTLKIYKSLYPSLDNFKLKNLCIQFQIQDKISSYAKYHCNKTKNQFHQSMYDCIGVFCLLDRLKGNIKLESFLN